jgi:hypothetical protein
MKVEAEPWRGELVCGLAPRSTAHSRPGTPGTSVEHPWRFKHSPVLPVNNSSLTFHLESKCSLRPRPTSSLRRTTSAKNRIMAYHLTPVSSLKLSNCWPEFFPWSGAGGAASHHPPTDSQRRVSDLCRPGRTWRYSSSIVLASIGFPFLSLILRVIFFQFSG